MEGTVQVGGTIARVGQRLLGGVSWTASSPACRSGWGERRPHGCYADIMVRTQVRLTEAQHRRLRRYAGRLGISLAEAVRRCVDAHLVREATAPSREARVRAALAVCGKYHDTGGETRVALNHDRHLDDAYGS